MLYRELIDYDVELLAIESEKAIGMGVLAVLHESGIGLIADEL